MTHTLDPKRPGGDRRNAGYLACACDLAYLAGPEGRVAFRERLGLDVDLLHVEHTQVYVGEGPTSIVAAFRGSENPATMDGLKDWLLTNANNFLTLPEGEMGTDFVAAGVGARFHRGFLSALQMIWNPLFRRMSDLYMARERPVWLTGHSLGGAVALLAAWRLQRQFLPVHEVVTFGAPMIGNDAAAAAFDREFPGKIHRFVNDGDFVPLLPTYSLLSNAYRHCPAEVLLKGKASALRAGAEAAAAAAVTPGGKMAIQVMTDLAGKSTQVVMEASLIDELWGHVTKSIDQHMVPIYLERLQA